MGEGGLTTAWGSAARSGTGCLGSSRPAVRASPSGPSTGAGVRACPPGTCPCMPCSWVSSRLSVQARDRQSRASLLGPEPACQSLSCSPVPRITWPGPHAPTDRRGSSGAEAASLTRRLLVRWPARSAHPPRVPGWLVACIYSPVAWSHTLYPVLVGLLGSWEGSSRRHRHGSHAPGQAPPV